MSTGKTTVKARDGKDMPLIKIFWRSAEGAGPSYVQITLTQNPGGQNLGTQNRLLKIAQEDFPSAGLSQDDVCAVVLGGDRRKGKWGIEFAVPAGSVFPDEYRNEQSELILSGGLT